MVKVKYVIVNGSAIVFSGAIQHKDMVGLNDNVEGAGFVYFQTEKDSFGDTIIVAKAYGESISLGIKSRGEEDSKLITRQISNPPY
jgi:hypothetical protein